MITFISDLDQTLIYSKRNINIDKNYATCVEYINDKSITYMTTSAYKKFNSLLKNDNFLFIPCTLRDYSQTMRISFIQKYCPKYMICDNGARIYVNGVEDSIYRKIIEEIIDIKLLVEMKNNIEKIINGYVKFDNNSFLTCIFENNEIAKEQLNEVLKEVNLEKFTYDLQNRKLYIIPKGLDKAVAVKYLIDNYNLSNIITSGDGKVDEQFTKLGQKILLPNNAVFHHLGEHRMNYDDILGGEEIIDNLLQLM